ncbi:MAG: hypothetical protein ACJ8FY_13705 [Gemmataceae bacterium]
MPLKELAADATTFALLLVWNMLRANNAASPEEKGGLMRFPPSNYRSNGRGQVISIAVRLDDMIEKCEERSDLSGILHRARREVAHLLHSEEQVLSRHEALAG